MRKVSDGFILKDYLLSLLIIMTLMPIVISSLKVVMNYDFFDERIQDNLSVLQIQKKMILANNIEVNDKGLSFELDGKYMTLIYNDGRLYLSPGYQLFLDDLQDLSFVFSDGLVLMDYLKDGKNYRRYIAKK